MRVRDPLPARRVIQPSTTRVLTPPRHRESPETRARAAAGRSEKARRSGRAGTQEAGAARGPVGPGPWHDAKHVSGEFLDHHADTRVTRRHIRFAQREVLHQESTLERVRKCGRATFGPTGDVLIRNNAGVAHYTGVTTCGSIWACPVCSGKIRNRRAEQISKATADWDLKGNAVYMATFTMPHDVGMRLKALLSTIADGFRATISGRAWLKLRKRLGVVGTIRAMEITHGANGWHPHLHVLIYVDGLLDAQQLADLVLYLRDKWGRFITEAGYRLPSDEHGVDVQRCHSAAEAGAYVAKTQEGKGVGNEMARADLKQGRQGGLTPFELLDEFRWTGDAQVLRLWHEYEKATKGRQCITWSKGLKALLLADEDQDQSDEEIAAEEVGGDDVALIRNETWRKVVARPGLTAGILDAAERGGLEAINELLGRYGVPAVAPPPEMINRRGDQGP